MKKIFIIVGTRPEAIKLFPVWRALKERGEFNTLLLTTGQHGKNMLGPIIDFFEVSVDVELRAMIPNQSINEFASSLLLLLDEQFRIHTPDLIVVQGDTTSCAIGSLAGFYRNIRIAHVEAGLRTYNKRSPYPEEINRRITSLLTDFHFPPTPAAARNLEKEKVEGRIDVVGNTVIDSLLNACDRIVKSKDKYIHKFGYLKNGFERLVAITAHRRENIGDNFREMFGAIKQLAGQYPNFAFVYPLHVNPVVRKAATEMLDKQVNIFLIEPLPYDEMVFIMQECFIMMTDSGGIQEECPSLNKPVMVLRDTTERPEGIEAGCSVLAGVKAENIVTIFNKLVSDKAFYNQMASVRNPYGDGNSSEKIAGLLANYLV